MSDAAPRGAAPPRYLSTLDAVSVVIGVVIGSGIFKTPPLIAQNVGASAYFIGVWIVGGVVALCGALCFAELGARYPREGGVYVFLKKGLGRRVAVYYGLCDLLAIHPATIGMMAFVHAEFAAIWAPIPGVTDPGLARSLHAALAIVVLASLNLFNLRGGSWTQNILSLAKVVGLSLAFLAACATALSGAERSPELEAAIAERTADDSSAQTMLGMAMLFVLFTYGGWNDLLFVAGEIENPQRNLRRALSLGVVSIAAIYVALNVAFLGALGLEGIAASKNVVADVVDPVLGHWGTRGVAALISLCALGALNACIFTGSRVYVALGEDVPLVGFFRRWSHGTPRIALVVQAATALAMIALLRNYDGFDSLYVFSAPFFWAFMALVGVVYFFVILRYVGAWFWFVTAMFGVRTMFLRLIMDAGGVGRQVPAPWGAVIGVVYLVSTVYLFYCAVTYAWGIEPHVDLLGFAVSKVFLVAAGLASLLAVAAFLLADRTPLDEES